MNYNNLYGFMGIYMDYQLYIRMYFVFTWIYWWFHGIYLYFGGLTEFIGTYKYLFAKKDLWYIEFWLGAYSSFV